MMDRLYRAIRTAVLASSLIVAGCSYDEKEALKPNIQPPEAVVTTKADVQSPGAATYHKEISALLERVIPLAEDIFPQGGVMDIGKTQEGNNRYISIHVLKEDGVKTLEISSYIGLDSKLEEVINKYLVDRDYEAALKTLEENNNFSKVGFYDGGGNDLIAYTGDFLIIRNRKGEITALGDKDLAYLLGRVDGARSLKGAYRVVLERAIDGLEKESEARKKEIKTDQSLKIKTEEDETITERDRGAYGDVLEKAADNLEKELEAKGKFSSRDALERARHNLEERLKARRKEWKLTNF